MRILVVDDDPSIRRLVSMTLRVEGFEVETVGDGVEALASMEKGRPALVVLDLMMPIMNGRECFRAMVQAGNRPPVLLLTAFDGLAAQADLGAEGCLAKPFDPQELANTVRSLLSPETCGATA